MSQVELFWAAASLMLLGALVSMCMKCQRSATKQEKKLCKQRKLHENQPGFQVIRSYSIAVTRQDEIKLPDNIPVTRKTNKRLQATDIDEDNQELDAAYVNPIASDYFNCGMFLRPANEKEEDSCSYQNVVIGASNSAESDDVDDYENSASIKIWKQSNISESPDDYPDYVNSDVAAVPN
ncbi:linker for activation of T-cells family member 2 isoform X2 [Chrysemys picta bellii]|uniref:linker for activation of T-cells family member 2 isoform X2 n=1 Tax=Chrysemys picta bellii TaxID=8478 RepID=UPI0032B25AB3